MSSEVRKLSQRVFIGAAGLGYVLLLIAAGTSVTLR